VLTARWVILLHRAHRINASRAKTGDDTCPHVTVAGPLARGYAPRMATRTDDDFARLKQRRAKANTLTVADASRLLAEALYERGARKAAECVVTALRELD
jgi:hypothetical protein